MNKKLIVVTLILSVLLVGGLVVYNQNEYVRQPLTEENYKAMVLSRIVPIAYAEPTEHDIDTKLNLQGQDGDTLRLYESTRFPTEGRLFVHELN
jgi:hypothetical protein